MELVIEMFRAITVSFLLFASNALLAQDTNEKALNINEQSLEQFGISMKALAYLITTDATNYLPVEYYKTTGEYKYFEQLEAAGYIDLVTVGGLPDNSSQEMMVQLRPTEKGIEVQSALQSL